MQVSNGSLRGDRQGLSALGKRLDTAEANYQEAFDIWQAECDTFDSLHGPWIAFDDLDRSRAPLREARSAYRARARTVARNKYKPPKLPPGISDDVRAIVVRARDDRDRAQRLYDELCADARASYRQITDAAVVAETAERIFSSLAERFDKRQDQQRARDETAQVRAFEWQMRRRERARLDDELTIPASDMTLPPRFAQ